MLSEVKTMAGSVYDQVPMILFLLACLSLEKTLVNVDTRSPPEELPVAAPNTFPKMFPKSLCAFTDAENIMAIHTAIIFITFFFIIEFYFTTLQNYYFFLKA
jgi:hypothetical protein